MLLAFALRALVPQGFIPSSERAFLEAQALTRRLPDFSRRVRILR
jgi:hypothetical protein